MIVTQPRDSLLTWLCNRVRYVPGPHMTCIARVERGSIVAVVGYDQFTGKACQMHIAGTGKNWMSRSLLFAAFDYPFNQLGLNVVIGLVDSSNKDAINLDTKLGFKASHRIANAHPDGDLILFEMQKQDCKWLSLKGRIHGKEISSSPS